VTDRHLVDFLFGLVFRMLSNPDAGRRHRRLARRAKCAPGVGRLIRSAIRDRRRMRTNDRGRARPEAAARTFRRVMSRVPAAQLTARQLQSGWRHAVP